jgi:hypothetical protein
MAAAGEWLTASCAAGYGSSAKKCVALRAVVASVQMVEKGPGLRSRT